MSLSLSLSPVVRRLLPVFLAAAVAAVALPAHAERIEREFPFEVDKWFALDHVDGDLTIHRIRVASRANIKSRIFRPGSDNMVQDVQIQIEYTNRSERDVETTIEVFWLDSEGRRIDGYAGKEDMDADEHDEMTAQRSTLNYGLEMAETLSVKILY